MLYYKVKSDSNCVMVNNNKTQLVANELYTQKQVLKFNITAIPIFHANFDVVNIKPKNTYYSFGARFESTLK